MMSSSVIALPGVGLLALMVVAFVWCVHHATVRKSRTAGAMAIGLLILGFCSYFGLSPRRVVQVRPSARLSTNSNSAPADPASAHVSGANGPSAEIGLGVRRAEREGRAEAPDDSGGNGRVESTEQMAARMAAEAFDKAADNAEAERLRRLEWDRAREAARWERQVLFVGLVVVMIASGYGFLSASTRGRRRPVLQIGSGVVFAVVCVTAWIVGRHF